MNETTEEGEHAMPERDTPTLDQIRDYLRRNGWFETRRGDVAALWSNDTDAVRIVHDPANADIDFVVFRISTAEQRLPADTHDAILNPPETDLVAGGAGSAAGSLRARLAEALATTTAACVVKAGYEPTGDMMRHGVGHRFHIACALCAGDVDALLDAVMPIVDEAVSRAAHIESSRCRHCKEPAGEPHPMTCPEYDGPVDHDTRTIRILTRDAVLKRCQCGTFWWGGVDQCPNEVETWRGPRPADEDGRT